MKDRILTITVQPDWRTSLRYASRRAGARSYHGRWLNFESPAAFGCRETFAAPR